MVLPLVAPPLQGGHRQGAGPVQVRASSDTLSVALGSVAHASLGVGMLGGGAG